MFYVGVCEYGKYTEKKPMPRGKTEKYRLLDLKK